MPWRWPQSPRNQPTGPGSRGGKILDASYWREWRSNHPEYREREARRRYEQRRRVQLVKDAEEVQQLAFGKVGICPKCKTHKGRDIYGSGSFVTSRRRALDNNWHIIGWRGWKDEHTVKVRCNVCEGRGYVLIDDERPTI